MSNSRLLSPPLLEPNAPIQSFAEAAVKNKRPSKFSVILKKKTEDGRRGGGGGKANTEFAVSSGWRESSSSPVQPGFPAPHMSP